MTIQAEFKLLHRDNCCITYSGTKSYLLGAGLATEAMFPQSPKRYRRRSCNSSPLHLGEWEVRVSKAERLDPRGIWYVKYYTTIEHVAPDEETGNQLKVNLFTRHYAEGGR